MRFLLTNDDSHESPLLKFTIRALQKLGELQVVVPRVQQSWKGKSMSPFGDVYVSEDVIHDTPCFVVDGTPADCVNLALHHLCERKPDVVISGINVGQNSGIGFMLASGTVGACIEANLLGYPAVAFSQYLSSEVMKAYLTTGNLPDEVEAQFQEPCDRFIRMSLAELNPHIEPYLGWCGLGGDEDHRRPITWNVNFPFEPVSPPVVSWATLGLTVYGNFFARQGSHYRQGVLPIFNDERDDCDRSRLLAGEVTITPINVWELGQVLPPTKA